MNLYARYETDTVAEAEGVNIDFGDGVSVRVRSTDSVKVRESQNRLTKKHRQAIIANGGLLPPALADSIEVEILSTAIVIDWKGVSDRDGKELPFTPANARVVFADLREFRKEVYQMASSAETFRKAAFEAVKGNSSEPSEPGSQSGESSKK